jgi:hypothetical protein
VFSVWFVSTCFKFGAALELSGATWLVSEGVKEMLRFSPCELLLLEAGS